MGTIELKGMEFFAYHGFYDEERKIGNKYNVDLTVLADLHEAAQRDRLSSTINYETLYKIVHARMQVPSKLLEHIAAQIGEEIMAHFGTVSEVSVRVSKFNPPIGGVCHSASVTIHQKRT